MLRNLNSSLKRLDKYEQQLATGKRVILPSDNPASVANIMSLKTSLMETEQFLSNVDEAYSYLDSADIVLGSVTEILHRAQELTVYAANDVLDSAERTAIAHELEQLFDNVLQLANASHGGKYIFAGQKHTTVPYQRVSDNPEEVEYYQIEYKGGFVDQDTSQDTAAIKYEISANTVIDISVNHVIKENGETDDRLFLPLLEAVADIIKHANTDDTQALAGDDIRKLDSALSNVLNGRAVIGAKINRIELAKERLTDLKLNFTKLLSKDQDIDVAETIMHLKSEENIYRTALAVGARIIPPSLVDFLR